VVYVVINRGTGTSDLPLRERPRGVSVGYGTPATIVVSLIVRFVVCRSRRCLENLGTISEVVTDKF
jgi:hypothetical protein